MQNTLKCEFIINCKFTRKKDTKDICTQFLLDNKFRNYIFNSKYNSICIRFIENYYNEFHLLILIMLKEKNKKIE